MQSQVCCSYLVQNMCPYLWLDSRVLWSDSFFVSLSQDVKIGSSVRYNKEVKHITGHTGLLPELIGRGNSQVDAGLAIQPWSNVGYSIPAYCYDTLIHFTSDHHWLTHATVGPSSPTHRLICLWPGAQLIDCFSPPANLSPPRHLIGQIHPVPINY